jgi:hypothetical protein
VDLASGDTAKDIAEGEKLLAEGRHQAFKLKIGARELATDLRHTRAIVEALGDRASIRVDVNQAWDATGRERLPRTGGDGRRSYRTAGQRPRQRRAGAPKPALKPRSSRMKRWRPLTMAIAWRSRALPALTR